MKQIAVLSGKGGTGKTSLTASLAAMAKSQAVLVDADVDAPNLALVADPEQFFHQSFIASGKAFVHTERCQQCMACIGACRFDAISLKNDYPYVDPIKCEGCGLCAYLCTVEAISMEPHTSGYLSGSRTRWKSHLYHGRLLPGGHRRAERVEAGFPGCGGRVVGLKHACGRPYRRRLPVWGGCLLSPYFRVWWWKLFAANATSHT